MNTFYLHENTQLSEAHLGFWTRLRMRGFLYKELQNFNNPRWVAFLKACAIWRKETYVYWFGVLDLLKLSAKRREEFRQAIESQTVAEAVVQSPKFRASSKSGNTQEDASVE